jgi:hypothetical protein
MIAAVFFFRKGQVLAGSGTTQPTFIIFLKSAGVTPKATFIVSFLVPVFFGCVALCRTLL